MFGGIVGDIVGSRFEFHPIKSKDFELVTGACFFSDDSVMTAAVADALLTGTPYAEAFRRWGWRYPKAGYGGMFQKWLEAKDAPSYGSFGNGSGMRAGPVAWVAASLDEALALAEATARPTHDHPEGVKGAQAVAGATFLARGGTPRARIRAWLADRFGYAMDRTLDQIRPGYRFDVTCQGSVPEALIAALDSTSFEDALRGAVSLGGDADTLACMAGFLAEALYGGVPPPLAAAAWARLDPPFRDLVRAFHARFRPEVALPT